MLLMEMNLSEVVLRRAGKGVQQICDVLIIAPRQRFDVLPADRIGFARGLVLQRRQWRDYLKRELSRGYQREFHRARRFGPDLQHDVLAPEILQCRIHRVRSLSRHGDAEFASVIRNSLDNSAPFLVLHFYSGLWNAPQVFVLHKSGDRFQF